MIGVINCSHNDLTSLDLSNVLSYGISLYGNKFSACALDSMFSQLRDGSTLTLDFNVFVKDGDISLPGTDGCREYIATDKNWDVFDYSNGNPVKIDNTGHYTCEEIGTSVSGIDAEFSIYPNPVYDELHIKGSTEIKSIAIYSLAGKLFEKIRMSDETNSYSLNLSELSSGIYFLLIETPNGMKSQKIIKR